MSPSVFSPLHTLFAILLLLCAGALRAEEEKKISAEAFLANLQFQSGKINLPGGKASLNLPPEFRYLSPADAEKVLTQAWGNPPGNPTLGMIFPADVSPLDPNSWGVVITYQNDGHVKDDDAEKIDYAQLLKDMQEGIQEENKERKKSGYQELNLVGWAENPYYDKNTHKMYWAQEFSSPEAPEHTLNYNVRVLGRDGVLVLNAVAGMKQIGPVKEEMKKVLAFSEFIEGQRYADFNEKTDKVAEYGLAALVAGGVASKLGLFGKLFAFVLAFKKVLIGVLIALIAGLAKLFGRKSQD
ncbi:DUF2167 domain-containing protein [Massilia sp. W12]|uniref:DUF2167 domain-containing protein n=1 Tax=Massilia sp. W12 TaxID=3126507 RepID=UPI0030CFFA61